MFTNMWTGITQFTWNITSVGTKIFISFLLGFALFIFCGLNFPNFVDTVQGYASIIVRFITSDVGIPVQYNVWVQVIMQEQQFVIIFFVIMARMLMTVFGAIFRAIFSD